MASNYPAALDTTATLPAAGSVGANLSTFPHSTLHGNADDAIIAIETELGLAPSDTFSTVKARLDAIAAMLAGIGPTGVVGALTAFTPSVVQGVTPTTTVNYATWNRVGRRVFVQACVTLTSSGTASSTIVVGLPVNAKAAMIGDNSIVGRGMVNDGSAQVYVGHLVLASANTVKIHSGAALTPPTFLGSSIMTAALVSGDIVTIDACYEAAAD